MDVYNRLYINTIRFHFPTRYASRTYCIFLLLSGKAVLSVKRGLCEERDLREEGLIRKEKENRCTQA